MTDLKELAVAYWRLKKWVSDLNTDKKLPAESALRVFEEYISNNNIEIVDLTNQIYDAGLAVEIIYCENNETPSESPIITEMLRPVILQNNNLILNGQVVISQPIKPVKKRGRKPSTKKDNTTKKPKQTSSKK